MMIQFQLCSGDWHWASSHDAWLMMRPHPRSSHALKATFTWMAASGTAAAMWRKSTGEKPQKLSLTIMTLKLQLDNYSRRLSGRHYVRRIHEKLCIFEFSYMSAGRAVCLGRMLSNAREELSIVCVFFSSRHPPLSRHVHILDLWVAASQLWSIQHLPFLCFINRLICRKTQYTVTT